jgi:hypothetical protein
MAAQATVYLEEWQKRMVKDFSKLKIRDITKMVIKYRKGDCNASYKVPATGVRIDDWLIYLTDQQALQVKEQLKLRTPVFSVNVTREGMEAGTIAFQ